MMFFTLSALLFGLKWDRDGKMPFDKQWIKKRGIKIVSSLYPFLIVLLGAFVLFGVKFCFVDAVLNFLFLGWIAKLPGNGHLWFLTVLAICYILFYIISKCGFEKWNRLWAWIALLTIVVVCVIIVEHFNLPGHAFPMLLITAFTYINAKEIMEKVKNISMFFFVIQFIIITTVIVILFQLFENYQIFRPLAYLLYNVEGMSIMALLLNLNFKHHYEVVGWLSGISFELYLVHHGFCQGAFSILNHNNYLVSLILLFSVSLVTAYLLKLFAKWTQNILKIILYL